MYSIKKILFFSKLIISYSKKFEYFSRINLYKIFWKLTYIGYSTDNYVFLIVSCALIKEIIRRVLNINVRFNQISGFLGLNINYIVEMQTGEGKTYIAIFFIFFNYLRNYKIHIVLVNDYLANRDFGIAEKIFLYLNISVEKIISTTSFFYRKKKYSSNIIYITNRELCFDYLKEKILFFKNDQFFISRDIVLIDEIDSILIDQSHFPFLISKKNKEKRKMYYLFFSFIPNLIVGVDFYINRRKKFIYLYDSGYKKLEIFLLKKTIIKDSFLFYYHNYSFIIYYLNACLNAIFLYKKNIDYIVLFSKSLNYFKKIVILDNVTGRCISDGKWADGLHQAIEIKENVPLAISCKAIASTTYQVFFQCYFNFFGMTGTIQSEALECFDLYKKNILRIPINKKNKRIDHFDYIFLQNTNKIKGILNLIKKRHNFLQPILLIVFSVENCEFLSFLLSKLNINHYILNAFCSLSEKYIIGRAGLPGAVTVSTNMVARGIDIILGGEILFYNIFIWQKQRKKVIDTGGLLVIGFERSLSERVDNQLCGRAGRQGEPGETIFFLSLEDNLFDEFKSTNIFLQISNKVKNMFFLQHNNICIFIKNIQSSICALNLYKKKALLEFILEEEKQKQIFYRWRKTLINIDVDSIDAFFEKIINYYVEYQIKNSYNNLLKKNFDFIHIQKTLVLDFGIDLLFITKYKYLTIYSLRILLLSILLKKYYNLLLKKNFNKFSSFKLYLVIFTLDDLWDKHLINLEIFKKSILIQKNIDNIILNNYTRLMFNLFKNFFITTYINILYNLFKIY